MNLGDLVLAIITVFRAQRRQRAIGGGAIGRGRGGGFDSQPKGIVRGTAAADFKASPDCPFASSAAPNAAVARHRRRDAARKSAPMRSRRQTARGCSWIGPARSRSGAAADRALPARRYSAIASGSPRRRAVSPRAQDVGVVRRGGVGRIIGPPSAGEIEPGLEDKAQRRVRPASARRECDGAPRIGLRLRQRGTQRAAAELVAAMAARAPALLA